jgi:uncharacterized protein YaiI (UPF0178 family)
LIDARSCAVKAEIYRLAGRYGLRAVLVTETEIGTPFEPWLTKIVTGPGLVATIIRAEATGRDLLVTDDPELAGGLLNTCARILTTRGQRWTDKGPYPPLPVKARGNPRARFLAVLEDEITVLLQQPRKK